MNRLTLIHWQMSSSYLPPIPYTINYRLRSEKDNVLGSVRLSVHVFVCLSALSWLNSHIWSKGSLPVKEFCLCVCDQEAYANNLADAVYQLLI